MEKMTNTPSVGGWEGNNIYPIPVFTAPGKKIHCYVLRQEDFEEFIQVCEPWGGCPVLSGNIVETVRSFVVWTFQTNFPWKGKKEVSLGTTLVPSVTYGVHYLVFHQSTIISI